MKEKRRTEKERRDDQVKAERQGAIDTNPRHKKNIKGKEHERK